MRAFDAPEPQIYDKIRAFGAPEPQTTTYIFSVITFPSACDGKVQSNAKYIRKNVSDPKNNVKTRTSDLTKESPPRSTKKLTEQAIFKKEMSMFSTMPET